VSAETEPHAMPPKPIRLFTAFHANLDFSALPEADRSTVISRCYWPLLALPEEYGIPIGVELSARTLEILEGEDPEWVKRFVGLAERGQIEPIASGRAQIVAPLAATEINRLNLSLGAEAYQRLLGFVPTTYFVNEQTWADGLASLYSEVGAERVIMEWNNPAAHRPELRPLRLRPARLRVPTGEGPALLFNDSIVFQKIQRAAQGETPASEVCDYVEALAERPGAESLCLYGGDVEIFDYRPSRNSPSSDEGPGLEMGRLHDLFRRFHEDDRYAFALPREIVPDRAGTELEPVEPIRLPVVALGSASDPIPCKKQPRYNPTRWAVSGRDGLGMNTRCEGLLRSERAVRRMGRTGVSGVAASELVDLWRSDFRTRATEEKIGEFESRMGRAQKASHDRLAELAPQLLEGEDLVITNPGAVAWEGMPIEVPLRFPPGRHEAIGLSVRRGEALPDDAYQLEVQGRYRDGSLREATLVLEPTIEARGSIGLSLNSVARDDNQVSVDHEVASVGTDQVQADFLGHRGGAIEALRFPALNDRPLIGTIPHGHFDTIAFTPDFYSGHVVALTDHNEKRTDLSAVRLSLSPQGSGPVRLSLEAAFDSPFGRWRKIYRLYRNAPRLDVLHDLAFNEAKLCSLRLGTVTLRPDAWDRESLRYGSIHGGVGVEWRGLAPGLRIRQSDAVSSSISASSCLGATEGWVALADRDKGILVSTDRARAAVVPMLDFEEVDGSFFCRLGQSAAENDETRASFLRGRLGFRFAIEGFDTKESGVIERARLRHHGLVYRTENEVGITSGL